MRHAKARLQSLGCHFALQELNQESACFGRKMGGVALSDPQKLREVAAWYRSFAEKAANPMIWEA